jgi:hypothetical protein
MRSRTKDLVTAQQWKLPNICDSTGTGNRQSFALLIHLDWSRDIPPPGTITWTVHMRHRTARSDNNLTVKRLMGFYGNHIVPRLVHLAMRNDLLTPYRRRVLSAASGRVLEIGIGSGVNLPFYRTAVRQIIGIEPSPKLLEMTGPAQKPSATPIRSPCQNLCESP